MSMLRTPSPFRHDKLGSLRVPVVMPLVEVSIDDHGELDVLVDRTPYAASDTLRRADLQHLLEAVATDLRSPLRVQVNEADGTTFTDIITPSLTPPVTPPTASPVASSVASAKPVSASTPEVAACRTAGEVAGDGFLPHEDVAVAVVVAHQLASDTGAARLRLPPALLAAHPGLVVLVGQRSGTVVISGGGS